MSRWSVLLLALVVGVGVWMAPLTPIVALAQDSEGSNSEGGSENSDSGSSLSDRWDIDDPFSGQRPFQLEAHAGFAWFGVGFVSGVRFGIPIIHNGFIESLNNAVYINFGADFYFVRWQCGRFNGGNCDFYDYAFAFGIPATLHWEFYFSDMWSAFAEVGGQFFFHPRWLNGEPFTVYDGGYWFVGAVGARMHLGDNFAITLRVGSPYTSFSAALLF